MYLKMNNKTDYMNGSPLLLFKMMIANAPIPVTKWGMAMVYFVKAFFMWPFALYEKLFLSKKIENYLIVEPPIFIIGHYRSGTTFLHKALACDSRWGKINTYNFLFPYHTLCLEKILKPFFQSLLNVLKIRNVHFNKYLLQLDDPLEEDMISLSALTPHSAFWGELFPKHAEKQFDRQIYFKSLKDKEDWKRTYLYLIKKISLRNNGKRLLLKNPPNTGRVKAVLEMFPNAKFVFIYRNPYQVFFSTYRLWKETLERNYALQKIDHSERLEIIYSLYTNIMSKYLEEKELILEENLIEIKYEDLIEDPLSEVKRIYFKFDLTEFEKVSKNIKKLLNEESEYETFNYTYDQKIQDRIYEKWGYFIDRWKYQRL